VSSFIFIGYFTLTNAARSRFQKDSGRTITFTEDTACLQFSDDAVANVAIQTTPLADLTVAKIWRCWLSSPSFWDRDTRRIWSFCPRVPISLSLVCHTSRFDKTPDPFHPNLGGWPQLCTCMTRMTLPISSKCLFSQAILFCADIVVHIVIAYLSCESDGQSYLSRWLAH